MCMLYHCHYYHYDACIIMHVSIMCKSTAASADNVAIVGPIGWLRGNICIYIYINCEYV